MGPVVRQPGWKDLVISSQHPSPVAVKVAFSGTAATITSTFCQPGNLLQLPPFCGGCKQTVTSVGCAEGAHVFGFNVALTALPPPGSRTSSGGVNVYWQPMASVESSAGAADATTVAPLMAPARASTTTADSNVERSAIIV
jgi:hypothetical protein